MATGARTWPTQVLGMADERRQTAVQFLKFAAVGAVGYVVNLAPRVHSRAARTRAAAYRAIAVWWAASRVVVLGTALALQAIRWPHPHWFPSVTTQPFALLRAFDGRWYAFVATHGYLVLPR